MLDYFKSSSLPEEAREITEDITKGIVKGIIEKTEDKIKSWAIKIMNQELACLENEEVITNVKKQEESSEWDFYKKYVKDKKLRTLIKMGLTLRDFEENGKKESLENMRNSICNSTLYGTKGLHIAQFVQNGLLLEHITKLLNSSLPLPQIFESIEGLLNNLETRASFIQQSSKIEFILEEIKIKILAHSPDTYFIFARDSALPQGIEIIKQLENSLNKLSANYDIVKRESKIQITGILSQKRSF